MKFKVKVLDLTTGGVPVAVFHYNDLHKLGIKPRNIVILKDHNIDFGAVVDATFNLVKEGEIGINKYLAKIFGDCEELEVVPQVISKATQYIRKKLMGQELSKDEIKEIIEAIVDLRIPEAEIGAFIAACQTVGMSYEETKYMTEVITESGETLELGVSPVLDKHCIGGVPNNRTTMLVVPIIAAMGYYIPKTSSRAITSPAGTADTMEVLANVEFKIDEVKEIVLKTHGCIVWGGATNIAPADDIMIQLRRSLSLDPEGLLLSSILSKKKAVGAQHLIIDIPIGPEAKVVSPKYAQRLKELFETMGRKLNINTKAIVTDGRAPIGNGIGPALEARDVLSILMGKGPKDLREKALLVARKLLECAGLSGDPEAVLNSGKAYEKMKEIIETQGGDIFKPEDVPVGQYTYELVAQEDGQIEYISNKTVAKVCRILGNPSDKGAGIYLHKKLGDYVKKGEVLATLYAESEYKLTEAIKEADKMFIRKSGGFLLIE
jgi:AMP phosphorylase